MATAKRVAKTSAGKRVTPIAVTTTAKTNPATQTSLATKPATVAKSKAPPKAVTKESAPKTTAPRVRTKKPAKVSAEQRRNYIEVAAYHIAERRGFAPGDSFDDWVRAEAEIDRLIANGLLGG